MEQADSRTEQPTPLRLDEARRAGLVARSAEVIGLAVLLTGLAMLVWLGPALLAGVREMTATLLDGRAEPLANPAALGRAASSAIWGVVLPAGGIVGACLVAAILAGLVQIKPMTTFEPIRPQWSRLRVWAGLKRMASARGGVRTGLAAAKFAVLAWLVADAARTGLAGFQAVAACDAEHLAAGLSAATRTALVPLFAALAVLAAADWLYQRWQFRRDLRITRQQWKEDLKRMEGDPAIHAARRKARRNRRRAGAKGQTA
ncbi:MAG: EscU/YscU/HrcU family type III secretion system export apparatus switch protein [Phycisphaerae bacterium]|nr:EscU/YscU/HrcU family type III secretion system export apparatus switch protein [Phycisphaerae bacterium]